ncbi:Small ubiquitin modifier 2 [Theobroma cacao]|uniref:Small ubiquitin modifier 2 n=1 Tax=Theobroma cacao TaxID=3641 RepID=A0A061EK07_THECC|nr:Small ubiquitin modifier 2 [Theobroma cacao]
MSSPRSEYLPNDRVRITVKNQDGEKACYSMKRTSPLCKLMKAHCSIFSLELNTASFLFGSRCLHEDETPEQVGMEDVEKIECMIYQIGG